MKTLILEDIIGLHDQIVVQTGGASGLRDINILQSAVDQPHTTFGGQMLYPDVISQAGALGFSLINNHPFVDGNKRIGHGAMHVYLYLHGFDIEATVDEQEQAVIEVASGHWDRTQWIDWLRRHIAPLRKSYQFKA